MIDQQTSGRTKLEATISIKVSYVVHADPAIMGKRQPILLLGFHLILNHLSLVLGLGPPLQKWYCWEEDFW